MSPPRAERSSREVILELIKAIGLRVDRIDQEMSINRREQDDDRHELANRVTGSILELKADLLRQLAQNTTLLATSAEKRDQAIAELGKKLDALSADVAAIPDLAKRVDEMKPELERLKSARLVALGGLGVVSLIGGGIGSKLAAWILGAHP